MFDLGDTPIVLVDGSAQRRGSVVAGLAAAGVRGTAGRAFECLQVRLPPALAAQALGAGSDLAGEVVALEDLLGSEAVEIQERLRAARSWRERFAIAEATLARQCEAGRAVDPEVAFAWRRIRASCGRVRIQALATELGWSRKRLWSRFQRQIGLTPKHAARLVRFDHASHCLAAGRSVARVAADSGYADQSHLHRDVREFTGLTPTAVATTPFLTVDDVAWPDQPCSS